MKHLGIETSCDDCSIAVLDGLNVLSVSTASQNDLHQPFGGIVPEIASRRHLETFQPTLRDALSRAGVTWDQIECMSVTNRPGLLGSLLVGLTGAKTLAYFHKKPLVLVHHLEAHLRSIFLDRDPASVAFPLLVLLVSGGHTQLLRIEHPPEAWPQDILSTSRLGHSIDDAAGEAFDKTAKLLGFPYPGGPEIDRRANFGDPKAFRFPRPLQHQPGFDFSFSGLKTAVATEVSRLKSHGPLAENTVYDLCASIQAAILDSLIHKVQRAMDEKPVRALAIVGGVAANRGLRERLEQFRGVELVIPKPTYCTDNGAMVAAAGFFRFSAGQALSPASSEALTATAFATAES